MITSSDIVQQCVEMLSSAPFFLLLSQLTGLQLNPGNVIGVPSSSKGKSEPETNTDASDTVVEKEQESEEESSEESELDEAPSNDEEVDSADLGDSSADDGVGVFLGNEDDGVAGCSNRSVLNGESDGPCCHVAVRQWTAGSYTLLHDTNPENTEFALDCQLFFGCEGECYIPMCVSICLCLSFSLVCSWLALLHSQ